MEYAGRGDPARTMALLWRTASPPRRGPAQRLDLDEIVDAAVAIADIDALAAVSMRGLAHALGIGTASLYTYVPGKAELLELMVDRVVGREPLPTRDGGRRAGLAAYARAELALRRRHPWLVQVAASRTVLGPGVVARYEAALGLLDGMGLPAARVVAGIATLDAFVGGAAAAVVEAEQAQAGTGTSDDEWWEARAPILDEHLGDRFPLLSELAAGGGFDVSATDLPYTVQRALDLFASGLEIVLDGLDQGPSPGEP